MYSDQDLNNAIKKGIFSQQSVNEFRQFIQTNRNTALVDEENFKLITSFNDIFVLIACGLLLTSLSIFLFTITDDSAGIIGITITSVSWLLAEYFVRKRKMALPAIALLISFLIGLAISCIPTLNLANLNFGLTTIIIIFGAILHWLRFKVPITIAAATGIVIFLIIQSINVNSSLLAGVIFVCGIFTFLFAMYWDCSDTKRVTYKTDVAFWLHLIAAPMIVHSVLSLLNIWEGSTSLVTMGLVILLYLAMTLVSLIIDRRALMVSALAYVIYALTNVIDIFFEPSLSKQGSNFTITGIIVGSSLLLLAVYWHSVRQHLLKIMPNSILKKVPNYK
ncbi:Uncharacterised protein [Phocoenobacter uteri]|uniref:DUF2157 domain-containing protein n=2 Tax=Phocoenobacter uteri TaxID=146806 RepID=A0A379C972_9PAST|nr:hypothetical protein [Phocoenobacter uteri]SUB58246.1 Uncharacterised protein [Phocoenobacter uteri]